MLTLQTLVVPSNHMLLYSATFIHARAPSCHADATSCHARATIYVFIDQPLYMPEYPAVMLMIHLVCQSNHIIS